MSDELFNYAIILTAILAFLTGFLLRSAWKAIVDWVFHKMQRPRYLKPSLELKGGKIRSSETQGRSKEQA
ncbi:cellulose biosynthesis protein BcsF [Pseudomonas asuensis]|jgi:hypothetical protein|uniref:Cellulose biosynthesis protein BcsF n=1 Tax=Pseudomonas asuensis TaxID=1825787 RepID=A0ABQ2GMN4_9PSED|nr:cellulose biosynthesis protein BcsF [Pseudomonas asuensis]GGM02378.1 hypothetical protein GCM10009425_12090 [Pseudomonas asuensis]